MLFNSYSFLIFLASVLAVHNLPLPWRFKKLNLIGFSYLFYAAWNPPFVILLWISTVVDWFIAKHLALSNRDAVRRRLLLLSLAVNLGLLIFFKYSGLLAQSLTAL